MRVTIKSQSSTSRQAGVEYLLLDSGAQLHACPIKFSGQKIPLPNPGIHTASGARLQDVGERLVTFKLPEMRTIRVISLECLDQQEYWNDLRADTSTLFLPDKIQTQHSQTQLHKE